MSEYLLFYTEELTILRWWMGERSEVKRGEVTFTRVEVAQTWTQPLAPPTPALPPFYQHITERAV